jgi:acetamidase/formamidase
MVETRVATHTLEPSLETVHFDFSREREPVLTVESGDTVVVRTLDAGGFLEPFDEVKRPQRLNPQTAGHALCGPIAVRDARPGQTLEVELREISCGTWGFTGAGGQGKLNESLGTVTDTPLFLRWDLDPVTGVGVDRRGRRVRLRPFMGVMGMPPDEPGSHPTGPPRFCGGNIDCKELGAGSRLFLPVSIPDALFSIGDGHALQGDGEVSGMAIECPMERVELVLRLHDDPVLSMPRARTSDAWITFGVHEDLDEAVAIATSQMLDMMEAQLGIERLDALVLASVAVDVRVTQMVNGVRGAHAVLRDDAIERA